MYTDPATINTPAELRALRVAIRRCVNKAISAFNEHETHLIRNDLSERSICAKFANYLEHEIQNSRFADYFVDVEYNRGYGGNENAIKQHNGHNIVLDLVVHKRRYSEPFGFDNLICIEMKKEYKNPDLSDDKQRLMELTDLSGRFQYKAGYMIVAFADHQQGKYGLQIDTAFYNGRASSA